MMLNELSLTEARRSLAAKDFSASELTKSYLAAIEKAGVLNAYITTTPEKALQQAAASDARIASGDIGRLEGLPLGIKDIFCTQGVLTTAGSHILDGFIPQYESTVTANLWQSGAICLGKLNMDEFAMGSSTETSYYGPSLNPWQNNGVNLVPGGSSGGSAAAVAGDLCLAATGTDTGGSIRQPASFTGIVGIKPTYGLCSRYGIIAFASSLDQAGPMTKTVQDSALLLSVMASHDPKDATSAKQKPSNYEGRLTADLRGVKIGIADEYQVDAMPAIITKLWEKGIAMLQDAGAEIIRIALPHTKAALPAYYILAPAEASSNLARYDGVRFGLRVAGGDLNELYENTRGQGFGFEVKRRILIGAYVLSHGYYDAYYVHAQKIRSLIIRDFTDAFTKVDAILTPTTPNAAFAIGEKYNKASDGHSDNINMYLNDIFTVPANLAGLPAISVPVGFNENGLPLGLQIIGRAFGEQNILNIAYALEQRVGLSAKAPKWWIK